MEKLKSHHNLLHQRNVLVQIDKVHAEIESENHYEAYIKSPTLGDGGTVEMFFRTPDTGVRCHTVVAFGGELGGIGELRESATVSLSGSVVTIFNNDRNSSNEATARVRSSPSLITSGTQFAHFHVGGGFQGRDPGESGSRVEWKLKQGTIYIFRYTSIAGSNEAEIEVAFYEQDES
jgi:hypothetical protein